MHTEESALTISAVLFPGFELLDLYGPLEMFGILDKCGHPVAVTTVAAQPGPLPGSAPGVSGVAACAFAAAPAADVLLVPGGQGTRALVNDAGFLDELRALAAKSRIVASVCTGSALLAKAGLLDSKAATSNKIAFDWVASQGPAVRWVRRARWVRDGNIFTASGVSAGMDMALALIAHLYDRETALAVAKRAEYTWHENSDDDPFAAA